MRPARLVLAFLVALIPVKLAAAELKISEWKPSDMLMDAGQPQQKILLSGPIRQGDTAALERAIAGRSTVVSLHSNGGSYREGLALAVLLHDRAVPTIVEDGHVCLSACAIAFLGGTTDWEEGERGRARSLARTAVLGFHAPFLNIGDGNFNKAAIEEAYDSAVRAIVDFVKLGATLSVDPLVAIDLMGPQRDRLAFSSDVDSLGMIGIAVQELDTPGHLTRGMAFNYCVNGWGWSHSGSAKPYYARAKQIVADLGWTYPVFAADGDYTGAGSLARRTIVPVVDGGEGGYNWCLLEFVPGNASSLIACRGFLFAQDEEEALRIAKAFDSGSPTGTGNPDYPCTIPAAIDAVRGYERSMDEESWAFVPADTPLVQLNFALMLLMTSGKPLR